MLDKATFAAAWAFVGLFKALDAVIWFFIRTLRAMVIAGVALGGVLGLVVVAATWEATFDLPDDPLALIDGRDDGSVTVLDRDGRLLGVRGQRFRRLTVEQAGDTLISAILSTEDRRYYWHVGVDPIGIGRAIWVNYQTGGVAQGGSSITQQVAKLAFLSHEQTFARKLRELPLALALEWMYSKDEILEIYLNRAYLGGGAFGFRAAARLYFDKEPIDLTAAEAALLAGLLRAPSRWSPTNNFQAALDRAAVILGAMLDNGAIDQEAHDAAIAELPGLQPPLIADAAPHFVDWIADQIPERLFQISPDLVVTTTLDSTIQITAEQAIEGVFATLATQDADAEAAMVILSPDGAVRAMVGGRDYGLSQFNRATDARRQMGSSFKPIVYAAALEAGVPPGGLVADSPISIGSWSPANYSHRYRGVISIVRALAISSNVAAVRMSREAGISGVVGLARRLGFTGDIPAFPSLALGVVESSPLEVASAYAVFRNSGRATPAFGVLEARDPDGILVWRRDDRPVMQAMEPAHAEYITTMLQAVVLSGTGRRAQIDGWEVAGKTGTTQEYRDAWFAGYTSQYIAAVWVGRDDFGVLRGRITGGNAPAQIFHDALAPLHEGLDVVDLPNRDIPGALVVADGGDRAAPSGGGGGGGGGVRSRAPIELGGGGGRRPPRGDPPSGGLSSLFSGARGGERRGGIRWRDRGDD